MPISRWVPFIIWVLLASGFVGYCAEHPFYIGRMILPRAQAVALALVIVFSVTLLLGWVGLVGRILARRLGWARGRSLFDRPAVRGSLAALLVFCALIVPYGRYIETRWVTVRPIALGGEPPAGHRAVRVALISDLHIDEDREPFQSLAAKVNAAEPDVILFAGDTLNRAAGLQTLRRTLARMRAPHGKYAVRGNWEAWYWKHLPLLEGTGFRWLDAKRVSLQIEGQRLHLVGFPYRDHDRPTAKMAERMLRGASSPGWRILLYHSPDLAERVPSADLYLAGHTHGGQVSLPGFGALVTLSRFGKRFERGLVPLSWKRYLYTNPGIGVEPMVPLRIGVRPEITLLRLGRKQ